MAVQLHKWKNPFAVVQTKGTDIVSLEEKPIMTSQINAGLYVLSSKMINIIKKDKYLDMPDLFIEGIKNKLNLKVYALHESWIDIGRIEDYNLLCNS